MKINYFYHVIEILTTPFNKNLIVSFLTLKYSFTRQYQQRFIQLLILTRYKQMTIQNFRISTVKLS